MLGFLGFCRVHGCGVCSLRIEVASGDVSVAVALVGAVFGVVFSAAVRSLGRVCLVVRVTRWTRYIRRLATRALISVPG